MFIWSFGCMWHGRKPSHDWNGEPILYAPGEEMSLYGGFFLLCGVCCVTLNMAIHAMTFQIPPAMPAALCALLAWRQT